MTQKPEAMADQVTPTIEPEPFKSGRLHEFQARLLEQMSAARDDSSMRGSRRLGVMVRARRCLLDLREAGEIVSLLPIVKVPLTKDWYLGLANVRGSLISVVDLDRFLGGEIQVAGKQSHVIVAPGTLSVASGFLVSRILGLRNLQEMTVQKNEKDASSIALGCYLDSDRNEWTEISLARIARDPRFLHVGL